VAFDGDDTNVQIGQLGLAFRIGHLRHNLTNPVPAGTIPDGASLGCNRQRGSPVPA
jgi:hypothetical protein